MTTQQKVLDFLKRHEDCVMATVGDSGLPQAAVVGFSETPQLELMIGTTKASRKYRNLQQNPHVAIVVGFSGSITVQYEGTARVLSGAELADRQQLHFQKIPGVVHYKDDPDQVYFSISPTWVRYTDFTQEQPVEELRQFS
jgi:general stress protein 26